MAPMAENGTASTSRPMPQSIAVPARADQFDRVLQSRSREAHYGDTAPVR